MNPSEIQRQEFEPENTIYKLVCRVCEKHLEYDSHSAFHCSKECEQQDKERVTNG